MLVSNRLLSAALHALESELARQSDGADPVKLANLAEYARESANLRVALSCHGEDLCLTSSKIILPGE